MPRIPREQDRIRRAPLRHGKKLFSQTQRKGMPRPAPIKIPTPTPNSTPEASPIPKPKKKVGRKKKPIQPMIITHGVFKVQM